MWKVHVQLYFGKDAAAYRQRFLEGNEPDESPYGFHLAQQEGFQVTFSRDGKRGVLAKIVHKLFDFDVAHAWNNVQAMRQADMIWTITEGEAFGAALLMRLGLMPRKPIISNAVWLLNRWAGMPRLRQAIYRSLASEIAIMTVHSDKCLPIAQRAFPKLRCELMYFGINVGYFAITPPETSKSLVTHIVAAGNDRTRDWDTLLEAFGSDERFRLTIICQWLAASKTARHANVVLERPLDGDELRDLYAKADLIAVPMQENVFSGITVALEAAAIGKPILVTRTGGVPTYFDDREVLYAPTGDPRAMRDAVLASTPESRKAVAERAQARLLAKDYSTRGMIARYARVSREVFDDRGIVEH
ncbi:MAG: glycosyltransferase family 4 protein [Alphaproteobacteria bacterium]|nr:glycosyltransferase family 4 protein [Alphaproteobacteria bacterium]MBU1512965.1 glycosyltransferase family 4 protein [Alphaproteobacteria bacterium]MBU2094861.1 glycosyltransferase family 4 protein [Alphaproteobacteria bacterium]MBU2152767.1 glycosyltransferase family 4 protein [Alphaproteobacteria bacterium]MBU2306324.1 glycosyltransferase family 4 protein [Alphaproteobacteria bacterium]